MIDQRLGGDIVYIASKNAVFAGPEQRRLQRHQGRPGPPGPAARRRARRARHPGQRRQPRRRRARQRHLRRRLGRAARRRLRRARGGARRVLRAAHAAQARGAPRARRQRRRRPHAPTSSATPPACSSPSTPASPPPSCADAWPPRLRRRRHRRLRRPGDGRRRRRRRVTARRRSTASPTASSSATATSAGTSPACIDEVLDGLGRAIPDVESIGIDTWGVDYGLLDADGACSPSRSPTATTAPTKVIDDVHARRRRRRSCTRSTGCSSCRSTRSTSSPPSSAERSGTRAAHVVLLPDLLAYWLTGELRTELTNASTTGLARRAHAATGRRRCSTGSASRVELLPPSSRRATRAAATHRRVGAHRSSPRSARTTPPRPSSACPATTERFAYIASGTWSLVGLELDAPVLTEAARAANFTNEGGVDGRTRFLRNVGGLWLLQECLRDVGSARRPRRRSSPPPPSCPPGGPRIDVDDPAFIPPGRHAGAHRRGRRRGRPIDAGRDRPVHPRLARRRLRPHGRPGRRRSPARPSTSSTSSAAAPERAALPAHRRRRRLPVLAGRSRPPPSATCSSRPAPTARCPPRSRPSARAHRRALDPTSGGTNPS